MKGNKLIEQKWSIVDGKIHVKYDSGGIVVWRINSDRSITIIADIDKDGEREDTPKERQMTFKKNK